MNTILNRMREPSTHAGISALMLALAAFMPQYATAIQIFAGLFGFSAAVTPESTSGSSF